MPLDPSGETLRIRHDGAPAKKAMMVDFPNLRVLVAGDVMLDRYLFGHCDRISAEAPVQVVRLDRRSMSLGGAANVAANLAALRLTAELAGLVGNDLAAAEFRTECVTAGIGIAALRTSDSICTTVKTRVLAADRQLLRIDEEVCTPISEEEADLLLQNIFNLPTPQAVILSDYAKGVCTPYFCQTLISHFRERNVPVLVDPKGNDYEKYRGATGIKPNRPEMTQLASAMSWPSDVMESATRLREHLDLEFVALSLGPQGLVGVSKEGTHHVPTVAREVFDVSGAGDTVVATLAAALAAGLDRNDALELASLAAGEVVGHVGSRPIQRDELLLAIQRHSRGERDRKRYQLSDLAAIVTLWQSQGLTVGFTNGCFDLLHAGHVALLEDSASRVDRLIVAINSDDSVRRLKGPQRPLMSEDQRVAVLCALEAVDAVVIFPEDTPLNLIETLLPDVLIKGGDYTRDSVIGADVVEQHGGRVELIPLVQGISTSYLAAAIEKL